MTWLERQPYTRGQRIGILRLLLHGGAVGASCVGGHTSWNDTLRCVQRAPGKEPASNDVEGGVGREAPGDSEIELGPEIVGIARHPAVLADGRPRGGADAAAVELASWLPVSVSTASAVNNAWTTPYRLSDGVKL